MEYAFQINEEPGEATRRVALEQLELALADLAASAQPVAFCVHEFRKRGKKLRALARLVRADFPGYKRANRLFGNLGRELCDVRDARIMTDLVNQLLAVAGPPPGGEWPVARHFREHCESAEEGAVATLEALGRETSAARAAVAEWKLDDVTIDTVTTGIAVTLERARNAFAAARGEASPQAFHELRKRCKDHWYHLCLLAAMLPQRLKPRTRKFGALCTLLGLSQDHSVLLAHMAALPGSLLAGEEAARLLREAATERDRLHTEILAAAEPLLDVDPDRIAARIGRQWEKLRA